MRKLLKLESDGGYVTWLLRQNLNFFLTNNFLKPAQRKLKKEKAND